MEQHRAGGTHRRARLRLQERAGEEGRAGKSLRVMGCATLPVRGEELEGEHREDTAGTSPRDGPCHAEGKGLTTRPEAGGGT